MADLAPVDPPGPAHDGRYPDAALLEHELLTAQRPLVRPALPAVVAGEVHQRVLLLPRATQSGEHLTHGRVQTLHHLRVLLDRAAVEVIERPAHLRLRLGGPNLRGDLGAGCLVALGEPGPVRGGEVEVEQPGPVTVIPSDVLDGPLGEDLGVVAQVLILGVALVEVVVAELSQLGEVLQHAPVITEELVPTGLGGAVVGQPAAVPLPDERGGVSRPSSTGRRGWGVQVRAPASCSRWARRARPAYAPDSARCTG